ncbi:MAG: DNA polymerase I [Candidatus Latescibacteria bacterium]|nr:DNA polymerase I [bacterium]MBD3423953.1 DNA polymerase I [Candidatus Latescibacterota bacterium]
MDMELILIDGHAMAYRAYYAMIRSPLTNSRGENTSAVFGFTRIIIQILKKYNPDHIAVIFDSGKPTKRHEIFPDYKANRKPMPDDMVYQIPVIQRLMEAMGITVMSRDGYEADDIIATLCRQEEGRGNEVRIISGDKDLFQLLSDRVRMVRPSKGVNLSDEVGPDYLEDKFGLTPEQITDYLALKGDSSDNIPGVSGIGEKTALKLLSDYGSLDNMLNDLDNIEPENARKKLKEGKEEAILSRELVRLRDVPGDYNVEEMKIGEKDREKLTELLLELDFNQFISELIPESDSGASADYRLVGKEDLDDLVGELSDSGGFVLDVETTSLSPMEAELVGISFCAAEGRAHYIPVRGSGEVGLFDDDDGISPDLLKEKISSLLLDESVWKTGHNIKYDLIVLKNAGMEVAGVDFDTMVASYCLDPAKRSHSLDNLALEYCQHRMMPYRELFDKKDRVRNIRKVPLDRLKDYACEDSDYTFRLKKILEGMLEGTEAQKLFRDIEMPLLFSLLDMEMAGIEIDREQLGELEEQIKKKLEEIENRIYDQAGEVFNIRSNKQLQRILFDKLELPVIKKTKTGYSTDMKVLEELAGEHPIAEMIIDHRQLSKLLNTYVEVLPQLVNGRTGRIHTSFNQTVTATGRLSSSSPNLQNIPIRSEIGRKIRQAFVPAKGNTLVDADYSQIELRILAHLSDDPGLISAFREGADIHTRTAATIFEKKESEVESSQREAAKTINYGVIYGQGPRALSSQIGVSFDEAKSFIDDYFEKYSGVRDFIESCKEKALENGYAETIFGRRRGLENINSDNNRLKSFAERIAVNMPIQGTAADMIKIAMIDIDRAIEEKKLRSRMILQVHDELVFEVPEDEREIMMELVREKMEGAVELKVPLIVSIDYGPNWLEAH